MDKSVFVVRDLRSHKVDLFTTVRKAQVFVNVNYGLILNSNNEPKSKHEYYVNDYLARENGQVVIVMDKMLVK